MWPAQDFKHHQHHHDRRTGSNGRNVNQKSEGRSRLSKDFTEDRVGAMQRMRRESPVVF